MALPTRETGSVAVRRRRATRLGDNASLFKLADAAIFFDFDNTVTQFDVIDDILGHFSINRDWVELERAWQAGRIGSKECLEGQLRSVRVSREALSSYLSTVPVDPAFGKLVTFLRTHGVEPIIVSDGFSLLIQEILAHQAIPRLTVCANDVQCVGERLLPSFPYANGCAQCAHCKKQHLLNGHVNGKTILYAGDGLSDVCPARYADLVFAKDRLLKYCRKASIPCVPFTTLEDIYQYLRNLAP